MKTIYCIICSIIIISFLSFSHLATPYLNSDHALNVLMAYDYEWGLFYCWGQDRGGTLIPLLGFIISNLFSMQPLTAVSIAYYLILIFGFWGFGSLLKNKRLLIPLAILWFFPYERFIELTSYPIGMSYSIIGGGILLLKRMNWSESPFKKSNCFKTLIVLILFIIASWVSDLILITLLGAGIVLTLYHFKFKSNRGGSWLIVYWGGFSITTYIVIYLKRFATGVESKYQLFNSISEIFQAFTMILQENLKVLLAFNSLLSLGAWVVFISFVCILVLLFKFYKSIVKEREIYIWLFTFDLFFILGVLLISHWVSLNGYGRWYFVSSYISGTILFLLLIDRYVLTSKSKNLVWILSCCYLVAGLSNYSEAFRIKGNYHARAKDIEQLNALGEVGIIGGYWHSFIYSIVNPKMIKSVENDSYRVRNPQRINDVFNSSKLFLVANDWLDSFPQKMTQYSVLLERVSNPFSMSGAKMCEYRVSDKRKFELSDFKYNNGEFMEDKVIFNDSTQSYYYAVYGPYTLLPKGKYSIQIFLETLHANQVIFDIYSNEVGHALVTEPLNKLKYFKDRQCFEFFFDINESHRLVEFRLLNTQNSKLIFKGITLNRR